MKNYKQYKEKLEQHDDPRYTFEHWENGRFYPSYAMDSNDLRDLRNEYKQDSRYHVVEKISDRAIVIKDNYNIHYLKSYYTTVAAIADGKFYKLWEGYSATTMKHINAFLQMHGFPTISKHDWVMMETRVQTVDEETGEIIWL